MTDIIHGSSRAVPVDNPFFRWWQSVDQWTLVATLGLIVMGLLLSMAASVPLADSNGMPAFYYVNRQAIYGIISFCVIIFLSTTSLSVVRRFGIIGFFLVVIALALLPIFGTDFGKGAVRWFSLNWLTIQPSEYLKPFFVIFISWIVAGNIHSNPRAGLILSFFSMAICVFLLTMQPDLGQTVVLIGCWVLIHFIVGVSWLFSAVFFTFVSTVTFIFIQFSNHVATRLKTFFSNVIEPTSQMGLVEQAIHSGGFLGVGAGNGKIKWSLPDAHTDFIIAVAIEEFGLIVFIIILILYVIILLRTLSRLLIERNPFLLLVGLGLLTIIQTQALINLGVAARLLPTKGMTLPFISYGGSSMVAMGILMGLLLNVTRRRTSENIDSFMGGT
ncbi:FtsW/RodA/SpoVE family cell cycle protein [Paracoccaceae bacterium]|nr:FtsW/RodA/SpoVE family cell cycle protein [Paracoccaceae bacterium]